MSKYNKVKNVLKEKSRGLNSTYKQQVRQYGTWLSNNGLERGNMDMIHEHVQEYLNTLQSDGKSTYTIHTACASICAVFNDKMDKYTIPTRELAQKGREEAKSTYISPAGQHVVDFAKCVGIRESEYKDLTGKDIKTDDKGNTFVIVESGKGGRYQEQLIDADDADYVKSFFEGKEADERIFTHEEMQGAEHANLHGLRRDLAQQMYDKYCNYTLAQKEALKSDLKDIFYSSGDKQIAKWDKLAPKLDTPYFCRGAVKEDMIKQGKLTRYDRLALIAVSVYHLAHWRVDVTVEHYMR